MADERTAARGTWGTVEWALDARRRMPAREFFLALTTADQAKTLALFQRLAELGRIDNREKFKALGVLGLFEFKSFQTRLLGDFRPGRRFLVAHGLQKKADNLPAEALRTAARVLAENDVIEKRGRG